MLGVIGVELVYLDDIVVVQFFQDARLIIVCVIVEGRLNFSCLFLESAKRKDSRKTSHLIYRPPLRLTPFPYLLRGELLLQFGSLTTELEFGSALHESDLVYTGEGALPDKLSQFVGFQELRVYPIPGEVLFFLEENGFPIFVRARR